MITRKTVAGIVVIALVFAGAITTRMACGTQARDSSEQQKVADQANAIAVRANGDWDKLTPSDQQFMLKIANGNKAAAKQLLFGLSGRTYEGKWGKPGPRPPVRPPAGGGTPQNVPPAPASVAAN